jgi:hypothetical protein
MVCGLNIGEDWTLYLGFGLIIWLYLLITYTKRLNTAKCGSDAFELKNPLYANRLVRYDNIKWWKEIYIYNIPQRNLIIGLVKKKIVITNIIAKRNYEDLKSILQTKLKSIEKI